MAGRFTQPEREIVTQPNKTSPELRRAVSDLLIRLAERLEKRKAIADAADRAVLELAEAHACVDDRLEALHGPEAMAIEKAANAKLDELAGWGVLNRRDDAQDLAGRWLPEAITRKLHGDATGTDRQVARRALARATGAVRGLKALYGNRPLCNAKRNEWRRLQIAANEARAFYLRWLNAQREPERRLRELYAEAGRSVESLGLPSEPDRPLDEPTIGDVMDRPLEDLVPLKKAAGS